MGNKVLTVNSTNHAIGRCAVAPCSNYANQQLAEFV